MNEPGPSSSAPTGTRGPAIAGRVIAGVLMIGGLIMLVQVAARRWQEQTAPTVVDSVAEKPRQPVRVTTVEARPIQAWVFADGTSRSVRREYLTFEMAGRVTFVGPRKEGESVTAGQVLAHLDKRRYVADVDSALASIEEAKTKAVASDSDTNQAQTQYALALSQFRRTEQLFEKKVTTPADYDEAKAKLDNALSAVQAAKSQAQAVQSGIAVTEARLKQMKIALEQTQLISPIDGVVAYLNVKEGYYFTPSFVKTSSEVEALQSVPMVVIDPSQYEITVEIPAYEAGRITEGQSALILPGGSTESTAVAAMSGTQPVIDVETPAQSWQARGEVYSINPAVNPGGRSIQVKIRTTQNADRLRDGMFVTCWIAAEENANAVTAPFDVFLYEENRPYVFVFRPETQTVERRKVQLGIQGLTRREIRSGVKAGEELVTDGRYRLVDGAPVTVLESEPSVRSGKDELR